MSKTQVRTFVPIHFIDDIFVTEINQKGNSNYED